MQVLLYQKQQYKTDTFDWNNIFTCKTADASQCSNQCAVAYVYVFSKQTKTTLLI